MENIILIICLVFSFSLGLIPVKWAGRHKKEKFRKNREYLDRISKSR